MRLVRAPQPETVQFLERASRRHDSPAGVWDGELRCGLDLGTATIVLVMIDDGDEPVYVESAPAQVVRDGVVVDFLGAVEVVTKLRNDAEQALGLPIAGAATAYPPGVGRHERRACQFVLERAGLDCLNLLDEVSAANAVLKLQDGVVVDVGGGSTGVGILVGGELVEVGDLPGGGHHLDLILAGALHRSVEDAERLKRERGAEYLEILRPGFERVATSIARLTAGYEGLVIHLVGGALMVPGAGEVVAEFLERPVVEYPDALFITPFGIARSAR
jgi:ethanolamine utilization protein EutJ